MTDPFLDELASAHLDGATTPEEAARIAADPSLQARVEALRQVRAALSEVPPADPVAREAGIAAALEAFAEATPTERSGALPAPPVLAPRRGPSSTALRVLGAAAAIALLALLVPVLGRLADGDDQQASFEQTGSTIGGAPDAAAGGAEDAATPTTTASRGLAAVGSFDDLAALLAAVEADRSPELFESIPASGSAVDEEPATCPPPTVQDGATSTSGSTIRQARAALAGDAVIVTVRTEPGGARTVLVQRADDCTIVAERSLEG